MKKQSGFTLIELMIVVAIVAILAAIALPAYQTYTKKAKFSEVVTATGAYKTAIEVCYQTQNAMTNCAANGAGGIPSAAGTSGFVTSVDVGTAVGDVSITAVGDTNVFGSDSTYIMSGVASGGQIIWTAPASGSTCTAAGIC
ncbi:pilin [Aeromonas salmonicida]|uniref:pilin n=1 Tax=Aeromonas salmonicida TaxID=645 RepID=UPI00283A928D|nr:prepilin-type N-terminal cleavage/methylation domain-containing protein [Aeromonas salmonicida]